MDTTNLKQTIAEMQDQKAVLDRAIDQLQEVLNDLNGRTEQAIITMPRGKKLSIADLGIKVLQEQGERMHIKEIARKVGEKRGRGVTRASMEVSFMQTIKRANKAGVAPLVSKYGRGIFGLTE
jgi:hypothetical protein